MQFYISIDQTALSAHSTIITIYHQTVFSTPFNKFGLLKALWSSALSYFAQRVGESDDRYKYWWKQVQYKIQNPMYFSRYSCSIKQTTQHDRKKILTSEHILSHLTVSIYLHIYLQWETGMSYIPCPISVWNSSRKDLNGCKS